MVLPRIRIDTEFKQFQDLERLYNKANLALINLNNLHPEYANVWRNVILRLGPIQQSLKTKIIPTRRKKKESELSTMLNYECSEMSGTGKLTALFELDNAYQQLGIKSPTDLELDKFYKKMGCGI
jgi:hypothetical protein